MTFPIEILNEIHSERARQIHGEGYTRAHDDAHDAGELSGAAAAYALNAACMLHPLNGTPIENPTLVGFPEDWEWKPKDPRRDLVRAAALIVAEIERMDRAETAAMPSVPNHCENCNKPIPADRDSCEECEREAG